MRIMQQLPEWLQDGRTPLSKRHGRTMKYFRCMFDATPSWLSRKQLQEFHAVYRRAKQLRKHDHNVHVDHIVPLVHELVCGLNVPWNLQIIGAGPNMSKGNKHWPNCPWETADFIGDYEPQQLRLL